MSVILNAGVPGNNSAALLARLDADVLAQAPTTVVLKVGTNDSLNSRALTPPDAYRRNLEELVTRITARCRLLLCTVLPYHEPYLLTRHALADYGDLSPAQRHAQVRTTILEVAAAREVPCCDLYPLFAATGHIGESAQSVLRNPANSGVADGVHPTSAGYHMLAMPVAVALRSRRLSLERIVCFGDSITYGQYVAGAGTAEGETYPAQLARILG
jgi:lysophospholipase L1-like esterase